MTRPEGTDEQPAASAAPAPEAASAGTEEQPRNRKLRIGGMALDNGVLFQTDKHWSMAIRREDGTIKVSSGSKRGQVITRQLRRVPMLRGLVNISESALVLPEAYANGGQLPLMNRSPEVLAAMAVSTAGTIMLRNPKKRLPAFLEELAVSGLAMLPSLVAIRRNKAVQYHAAEHKSINAYEHGGTLSEKAAEEERAEHPRCGSNIIGPALALMTVGNTLARRLKGRPGAVARLGVSVLSLSGAIEMVSWAARNPRSPLARILTTPGESLQHLITTKEPTEDQLDVGLAALRELLRVEGALQPA